MATVDKLSGGFDRDSGHMDGFDRASTRPFAKLGFACQCRQGASPQASLS